MLGDPQFSLTARRQAAGQEGYLWTESERDQDGEREGEIIVD